MKKRFLRFLGCLFLLLPSATMLGQTTVTESYLVTGPWTSYAADMKFSYNVDDEGERIMNGPIAITGSQNETYDNVTIKGSYSLKATAKDGNLNGAMSVKAKYHGVKYLYLGEQVEDHEYSFSGSFLNGIPNGTFTAMATDYGTSNVTYKHGVLVGSYNVVESIGRRIINIKGAFNDSGKMIGVWDIVDTGEEEHWEFVNGVRIRLSSKRSESTPKQIEMARKYAAGTITKEKLEEEGYFPVQDSIKLGDYADDIFLLSVIADWSSLPGFSFEKSTWVKYSYLYNLLPIPDSEFEDILSNIKYNGETPLDVYYNKLANCYTTNYWVNYGTTSSRVITDRRFTDPQLKMVKEAVDEFCRKNPITLEYLCDYSMATGSSECIRYVREQVSSFDAVKRETSASQMRFLYDRLVLKGGKVSESIQKVIDGKEKTPDGIYYIIPGNKLLSAKYLPVSSVESFFAIEKEIKEYDAVVVQKEKENAAFEAQREQEIKDQAAAEALREKNAVSQALIDNLSGIEKKPASIVAERLGKLMTTMRIDYYDREPKNTLNISAIELAEAISPTVEYRVVGIEKDPDYSDLFNIKMEFIKKKETIPVSMAITRRGSIIKGSIEIPIDVLERARKMAKGKQAVSNILRF